MKRIYFFLVMVLVGKGVLGQFSITGVGAGNTYTQNFDAFAGTLATVPNNWVWSFTDYTPGGFYNRSSAYNNSNSSYALRESAASTDNCFGAKIDGNTYTLTFSAVNNTGSNINGFTISWNVEQYSASTNATPLNFSYRTNTGAYGNVGVTGTTATSASTLGVAANLASISTTSRSITITGLSLANGGTVDFRFTMGNGTANNAHIGLDDFTVYGTLAGTTATLANIIQPTGNIIQGVTNTVLAGFSITPTASVDFTDITVTSTGTATSTDITNVRIFKDNDANGAINGADAAITGPSAQAYSASMSFAGITSETGLAAQTNYLVVADIAGVGVSTSGNTVTVSSNTFTTTAPTNTGSFTGNSRTIAAPPGTTTITAGAGAEPASISSLINTQGAAVLNFDFTVTDDGATPGTDGAATQISQLVLNAGTGNAVTNWTTAIAGVELSDGTNTTTTATIGTSAITFAGISNAIGELGHIADNGTKTYTLRIWLNSNLGVLRTVIDGQDFVFRIQTANVTVTGSQLAAGQDVNSGDGNNNVEVLATALAFVQGPSNGTVNTAMTPAVTVSANDANGNRDLGSAVSIDITSTGTLTGSPVTVAALNGLATFPGLTHSAAGTGLTLTAERNGTLDWDVVSVIFSIYDVAGVGEILINQVSPDYGGASDEYVELVNVTNKTFDLSSMEIRYSSAGGTPGGAGGTLSGILQPHSYWLLSPNPTVTVGLTNTLARDGSFTAGFAAAAGQLALVRTNGSVIIDGVGYGTITTSTYTEGTPSAAPPTDGGIRRVTDGVDNNTNNTDFITVTGANIDLRNSSSRLANSGSSIVAGSYSRLYVTGNSAIAGAITLSDKLVFVSGILTLGANDLTISNNSPSAALTGFSTSAYVNTNGTGALRRAVSGAGTYIFPVGTATGVQQASINFAAPLGAANILAARFIPGYGGTNGLPLIESGDNINATSSKGYWEVNAASAFGDPYTGTFIANSFGGFLDITKLHLLKRADAASNWVLDGTHVTTTGSLVLATLQRTGMSGFSQFGVGGEFNIALPVKFTNVKAYQQGSGIKVDWSNLTESLVSNYKVERSADGQSFAALSTVNPTLNNGGKADYSFFDANPINGVNFYRIQSLEIDGQKLYSVIVRVDIRGDKTDIAIYPNPVSGNTVSFQATALPKGQYNIRVINAGGQTVFTKSLQHAGGAVTEALQLPATITAGIYSLQVSDGTMNTVRKFIIR